MTTAGMPSTIPRRQCTGTSLPWMVSHDCSALESISTALAVAAGGGAEAGGGEAPQAASGGRAAPAVSKRAPSKDVRMINRSFRSRVPADAFALDRCGSQSAHPSLRDLHGREVEQAREPHERCHARLHEMRVELPPDRSAGWAGGAGRAVAVRE